nr:hypothetical protein 83 [bacterium]
MIIIRAKKTEIGLKDKAKVLAQIKKELIDLPLVREMCEELAKDLEKDLDDVIDIVHGVQFDFDDELDVSAKTIDSKVFLNSKLLSEPFEVIMRYAVHELTHALQHMNRDHLKEDPYKDEEYLDRPDEHDAFDNQVSYQMEAEGPEATREYVENLVDYHGLEGKEREEKIKDFMSA